MKWQAIYAGEHRSTCERATCTRHWRMRGQGSYWVLSVTQPLPNTLDYRTATYTFDTLKQAKAFAEKHLRGALDARLMGLLGVKRSKRNTSDEPQP